MPLTPTKPLTSKERRQMRAWMKKSEAISKEIAARRPIARKIAAAWLERGVDPSFLSYWSTKLEEDHRIWHEHLLDSQVISKKIKCAADHLVKAQKVLRAIPRLAFAADFIGREVIEAVCRRIDKARENLSVLGGKRLARGRRGETHVTESLLVLSEELRKRTDDKSYWTELAAYVNDLGILNKQLTAVHVRERCRRLRHKGPSALRKAKRESKQFWGETQ